MAFGTTDPKQEEALIARAIKGDGAAFTELMSLHETRMYAVALRMCANREDAQDCLQDAMLRVYRSISGFKGQSTFATWVYRITMNTCLDELRRGKRRKASSLDERIDAGWAPVDDMDTPTRATFRNGTPWPPNSAGFWTRPLRNCRRTCVPPWCCGMCRASATTKFPPCWK